MGIRKLGHVGIYAKDLPTMRAFYRDVVGLQIADETPSAVFMSGDPDREHHEFALFQGTPDQGANVQQISFSCESLDDIIDYYHTLKEHNVRVRSITSHGNAVGLYFFDPEDNVCEVYWTTPWKAHQPYGVAVDLTRPKEEILKEIEEDVKVWGATGHRDPESFERQKKQLVEAGIRV